MGPSAMNISSLIASFKAIFEPAKLDPTSMFLRLQQYVSGKALKHIRHLPIDDTSYQKAVNILNHQYDDKDAIIEEWHKEIHVMAPLQEEKTDQLRSHFDKIESTRAVRRRYREEFILAQSDPSKVSS